MKILDRIRNILHVKNNAVFSANKLEMYAMIIESSPQRVYILDKNKYVIGAYNMHKIENTSIPPDHIILGKHISFYINDKSSPISHVCSMLSEAIDNITEIGVKVELEYKITDSYIRASVSKISKGNTLIQIQDITNIMERINELESSNYKELSMALTAGNLTSWSYDVDTQILSSSHTNNIIGEKTTLEDVINSTIPKYRSCITKMFDDIINHGVEKNEITIQNFDLKGVIQWTNIHAIPHIYLKNGKVKTIVGSQKNITTEYEYNKEIYRLNKQNELIINNINSALIYITPDFKVVWENVSTVFKHANINNYIPGTYCYSLLGRDTPCENCVGKKSLQSHKVEHTKYVRKNGRYYEVTANPIYGDNDVIEGIVIKIDDTTEKEQIISDLKKAEAETVASNKILHAILDNLPSSIFVKDANNDYKYLIANKKLCEGFGLSENDVIGKTDYDVFPTKEEADRHRNDDIDTIENNRTKVINGEVVTMKNGVVVWHTVKTPLINIDNANQRLLVGIGLDITDSHNAYQELAVAKKKTEESNRLKSAFLANMSHEIRTPLNAIVGFSELMESCEDKDDKAEYMRIISTNNELLLRLINDILDLSKLDSEIIQLQNSEFDLAQFFDEMAATMRRRITNPNIEFITVNPYKSCITLTDKARMTQVWHNFMTNAIKYTVSGYIKMGYEYVNGGIKIYVEDTGIGISDDKKSKVFQRFEKLDTFAQGTGLGLSICKAISELSGGKVGFESEEGKGSVFWSWKPIDATIIPKTSYDNKYTLKDNSEPEIEEVENHMDIHNYNVLIAEDNDSNYLLINHLLKNDFQIFRVNNGKEAVEFVKSNPVNLVLMDIKMPVMDGLQATREIRKFDRNIPIIALTANAFDSDRNEAMECGCNDFITKPVHKEILLTAMSKIRK